MNKNEPEGHLGDEWTETRWSATEKFNELVCPKCGEVAQAQVDLPNLGGGEGGEPRYVCKCGNRWSADDFDNCVKCGKPLGRANIRCYSCLEAFTDKGETK
jgi:hypothetical protein